MTSKRFRRPHNFSTLITRILRSFNMLFHVFTQVSGCSGTEIAYFASPQALKFLKHSLPHLEYLACNVKFWFGRHFCWHQSPLVTICNLGSFVQGVVNILVWYRIIFRLETTLIFVHYKFLWSLSFLVFQSSVISSPSEPFQFQLFCKKQKPLQIFLMNVHLPIIYEVNHGGELAGLQAPHVEERVLVLLGSLQQPLEEWAARGKDHLVALKLTILTCQGHISKVFVPSQLPEWSPDILLKIVPFQAKFVFCIHLG